MQYLVFPYVSSVVLILTYNILYLFTEFSISQQQKDKEYLGQIFYWLCMFSFFAFAIMALINAGFVILSWKEYCLQLLFNHLFGIVMDFVTAILTILNGLSLHHCCRCAEKGRPYKLPKQPLTLEWLHDLAE